MIPYRVTIHTNSGSHHVNEVVMAINAKDALATVIAMCSDTMFSGQSMTVNVFPEQKPFILTTKS